MASIGTSLTRTSLFAPLTDLIVFPYQADSFVSGLPPSPISSRSPPAAPTPLAYKSDICRTYWIEGENACPFKLRCYFFHPPPSAHHTIARDTVASLEDPVAGVHLQRYQDLHNIQNLKNMQQAGVDIIASAALFSEPTIAQILEQVQAGSTSSYAVMPLLNGSIVPMAPLYPLQPFSDDCISTVSPVRYYAMQSRSS